MKKITLLLMALACLACTSQKAEKNTCTIQNELIAITFDMGDGSVISFRDKKSGMEMIDRGASDRALWNILSAEGKTLGDMEGAAFCLRQTSGSSAELDWKLSDGASVKGKVRMEKGSPLSFWSIEASGFKGLTTVNYPTIGGFKAGRNEKLIVSSWQGSLISNPRRDLPESGVKTYRWSCPGALNMQLAALCCDDHPGLYMSSNDSLSMTKNYLMHMDGTHTALSFSTQLSEDGQRDSYSSCFEMIIGLFQGDWHEAAALYRESAVNMPWFRDSRAGSGKTAGWAADTPVWVWNRGYSDNVLTEAADLKEYLGDIPVSVLWHWWHGCPYDDGFPEYIPPRDGTDRFKAAVAEARAKGINMLVYMNSIQWGNATGSWDELGVEKYRAVKRDGSDYSQVFNIFTGHALTPMCMGTDFWKNHYRSLCDTVINSYGVSGVYMDQACMAMQCYDPSHGHPLGDRNMWINNFGKLTDMIRSTTTDPVLAGEGSGETWMPYLDLFLTLEASRERYMGIQDIQTIPLFQAVYHDRAICFGSYSSLVYPPYDDLWPEEFRPANRETELPEAFNSQFRMEQARGFVWGTQPMIANYHSFLRESRPQELEYLRRLVLTRMNAPEYLCTGICTRGPEIPCACDSIDVSRISIYAGRHGNAVTSARIETPVIFSEGWKSQQGGYAVAITNISDTEQPVRFEVDPARYGIKGSFRVNIIDSEGRREMMPRHRGTLAVDMSIAARDAFLIEMVK